MRQIQGDRRNIYRKDIDKLHKSTRKNCNIVMIEVPSLKVFSNNRYKRNKMDNKTAKEPLVLGPADVS